MSIIAAGTTTTTALSSTGNTDGTLQLQVNGTTPSVTLNTLGAIGVGSTPNYGTSGQILTSGGSTVAPSWANPATVNLASGVTGTLPIANGGTNSTATPTAGGIVYGDGSAHQITAAGTSGQVLTSAGIGTPTWTTPSAGAMTLISTTTANNSATVDVTGITSAYDLYILEVIGMTPDANGNGRNFVSQIYVGGSLQTSNLGYVYGNADTAYTLSGYSVADNRCYILPSSLVDYASGRQYNLTIYIPNPGNSTAYPSYYGIGGKSGTRPAQFQYGGCYVGSTGTLTGLRFFFLTAGNIATGKFKLYGVT